MRIFAYNSDSMVYTFWCLWININLWWMLICTMKVAC